MGTGGYAAINMTLNNICFKYLVDYAIIPFSSDIFSVDGYGDIMDVLDKARGKPDLECVGRISGEIHGTVWT